ncbi:MAG: hypothetical protein ABI597_00005 [Gammaproteobacteria bacterium]
MDSRTREENEAIDADTLTSIGDSAYPAKYQSILDAYNHKPHEIGKALEASEKLGELKDEDIDAIAKLLKTQNHYGQWVPNLKVERWDSIYRYYHIKDYLTLEKKYICRDQQLLLIIFLRSQPYTKIENYIMTGVKQSCNHYLADSSFDWGLPLAIYELVRARHNDLVKFLAQLPHPYFVLNHKYVSETKNTILHLAAQQTPVDQELLNCLTIALLNEHEKIISEKNKAGKDILALLTEREEHSAIESLLRSVPRCIRHLSYDAIKRYENTIKEIIFICSEMTLGQLLRILMDAGDTDFMKWILTKNLKIQGNVSRPVPEADRMSLESDRVHFSLHTAVSQPVIDLEIVMLLCNLVFESGEAYSPSFRDTRQTRWMAIRDNQGKTVLDILLTNKAYQEIDSLLQKVPEHFSTEQLNQLWFKIKSLAPEHAARIKTNLLNYFEKTSKSFDLPALTSLLVKLISSSDPVDQQYVNSILKHRPDTARPASPDKTTTPLHAALAEEKLDIQLIKCLCESGAILSAKDSKDETPVDLLLKKSIEHRIPVLTLWIENYPARFSLPQLMQVKKTFAQANNQNFIKTINTWIAIKSQEADAANKFAEQHAKFKEDTKQQWKQCIELDQTQMKLGKRSSPRLFKSLIVSTQHKTVETFIPIKDESPLSPQSAPLPRSGSNSPR